ncbi:hypothetical protein ALQ37_200072 [Pseudomonas syringae pv. aptata]|uniref:Uncharacterized protein n=1 Tax=Pseudomonas syringae pv. aptata TaxID=83167 RepID=A0A3M3X770_PSEAP|nr:hypothetical protein [Pseudomonas syringae]RMO65424.1 hypothetical protein ALQ37_200072 [Pseudomonas syringae pv. aptata]
MAQQKKPSSIGDFLKKNLSKNPVGRHLIDVLGYTPDEEIYDPINGMQTENNPEEDWGNLGGRKVNSGIRVAKDEEDNRLNDKQERKLKELLEEFSKNYGYKLSYSLLDNDYTMKDAAGNQMYNFQKNGNFKYTGYDLGGQQYKDIVKITAAQLRVNGKIAYPFVAENDPKIPDSMQEKTLRLTIETLMEEGIGIDKIRIKSKKWGHLIDEYKNVEELKNKEFLGTSGIDSNANPSQAPPANEAQGEKVENKKETTSQLKPSEEASKEITAEQEATKEDTQADTPATVADKPAYSVQQEQDRLKKNLVWALGEANGDIALLASKNKQFHKDNFEISFTKNAELVHISNVRPNEDGNIVTINFDTTKITNGNVYIGQMDEYTKVIDAQKANGYLKHKLVEAVNFTKGDYEAFREKMLEDKNLNWGFTSDEKHLYASLEKDNGDIEFGRVSLAKGYGEKLVASRKGLLSKAEIEEDKKDSFTDSYDDMFFSPDLHRPEDSRKPDDKLEGSKNKTRLTV